jgi:hypothetical protein
MKDSNIHTSSYKFNTQWFVHIRSAIEGGEYHDYMIAIRHTCTWILIVIGTLEKINKFLEIICCDYWRINWFLTRNK